jgi:TAG lipase/steryl ester hydrolase/phospholipase A2/LPA acyltransferase
MADIVLHRLDARPGDGGKRKQTAGYPLSKLIRGSHNLVLSLRDGLTESEREDHRRTEERKAILVARMQNVRAHLLSCPSTAHVH